MFPWHRTRSVRWDMLDRSYRLVLDESPDGILVEAHDRIAYINRAYARLLGYTDTHDLASATIRDIAHPEDHDRLLFYGRRREQGKPAPARYEFRANRRDRSVQRFDACVWTSRIGGEILITTVVRAIIEERQQLPIIEGLKRLSEREHEIFERLIAGQRAKEIAFELEISEKTVATHRSRVYQKLAFRSDLDLFRFAAEHGLLNR